MKINNVNVEAAADFVEQVKADAVVAKKSKRVEGRWSFVEGQPQFSATMAHKTGETTVEADFAPFMGGEGLAPDPIQYCLYGLAACYGGTFVGLAAAQGVVLRSLSVVAENRVDLSRSLGLSDAPVVEDVSLVLQVDTDADDAQLTELTRLARERCPGVYCLSNPIPIQYHLDRSS
ncbi:MAG: OsmC family protein [Actinobacteria bacterium]|nr:OsmC family protein [Actinomycetota bacterium]